MEIKTLALRVLQSAGRTGKGQSPCLWSIAAAIAGLAFGQILSGTAFATDLVAEQQITVYPLDCAAN